MSDETFSRRWLLLSVIGMLTSFLLTIGIAAFGFRGVASADQKPARQASTDSARPKSGTFMIREIGGGPSRTATPTVGTAPTIRSTEEPVRPLIQFIQSPEGTPPSEPTPEPEPAMSTAPPLAPAASNSTQRPSTAEAPARISAPPSVAASEEPPRQVNSANSSSMVVPTSTSVPRLNVTATTQAATPTAAPPSPTPTAQANAARDLSAAAEPPVVTLQLSDSRIDAGDLVTVTVMGQDEDGLDWISWEGVDAGERALDRENREECGGRTSCLQSWTVRVSRTGSHTIQARARDTRGLKSNAATLELRVRAAASRTATPLPTATATPRASSAATRN